MGLKDGGLGGFGGGSHYNGGMGPPPEMIMSGSHNN